MDARQGRLGSAKGRRQNRSVVWCLVQNGADRITAGSSTLGRFFQGFGGDALPLSPKQKVADRTGSGLQKMIQRR